MQSILGNLIALIVFVIVSGVLFNLHQRSQLQSAEQSIAYAATARTVDLARLLEHDIENMLDATISASPAYCESDAQGVTTLFTLPTQDPLTMEEVTVTYTTTPTGEVVTSGSRSFRLYTLERSVETLDGQLLSSPAGTMLSDFAITFRTRGHLAVACADAGSGVAAPEDLDSIRVRFTTAMDNLESLSADQAPADRLHLRPYGSTFRPHNLVR